MSHVDADSYLIISGAHKTSASSVYQSSGFGVHVIDRAYVEMDRSSTAQLIAILCSSRFTTEHLRFLIIR